MIARLTGILAETASDSAVIDVAGVGYLVHLSGKALAALGPVGGDITVLTELQVREDPVRLRLGRRARLLSRADIDPGGRWPAGAGDPVHAVTR
jgi:hypothetical protein